MTYGYKPQYDNGYGASVISPPEMRGMFEIAVTHNGVMCYSSPITDNVIGWRTHGEVAVKLTEIEALPYTPLCTHQPPTD